ncbi:[protein-PII] uridylyltransferase [Aliikangiella coralliicola]|uniref:Bifunctional uridylyltransferase/uridylyl-removing enzyme n=1 Tax=Aliikangiella coralliicola TaxID=2592383 RepID=A0A545TW95_9GAMM|nr:[protein-PII] uridylyltransferase [Aliikangiella coralliicola]TQV81490.1 [protein-PII] uridylyltransferase [Aliikangiella coralliicola]
MKQSQPSASIGSQLSALLAFEQTEKTVEQSLANLKAYLETSSAYLVNEFKAGTNVRNLVRARARHIDKMLIALWQRLGLDDHLALIAVGGYGRGELHPHSDIDLLVLSENELLPEQKASLENLISLLWDCRLKVGHSVRTLDQCIEIARQDVTIATNIMESRLLVGNQFLFDKLKRKSSPDKIWDAKAFFEAKTAEQKARYKKFDGSSFDLEPNIKSSPGGLRDIHLISWVAQRIYYPKTLDQLIRQNLITKKEYYSLVKCQLFIWRVRFALHLVSGKTEDRLLFDYQKSTAKMMGYKDSQHSLAVEKMMKRYYRAALVIRNISDILLQVLEENVNRDDAPVSIVPLDQDFQIVNQRVDAIEPRIFVKKPTQLLRVFQHVAKDPSIKGITASTLRAIRAARYKITSSFRKNADNKQLFVEFWHILHTSSRAMFLMKRSGVLADYLEPFQRITGQMQYDMFHNYTVDEHTLFLLKNLSDFADPEQSDAFPLCSEIMQRQENPEIIFLAGLFHDIAKGRGGDHSELGAQDAGNFCRQHKLNPQHGAIVEWLVANHLLMSLIAQKRDISDPKVIKNFAQLVGDQKRLELLYILTVADIRATSNSLWNSWKDSLLKDLYLNTLAYLQQRESDIDRAWKDNQLIAKNILLEQGISSESIENLWQHLDDIYFSKRSPQAVAWQTQKILNNSSEGNFVVGIKTTPHRSGSEVFVYGEDKENLFAALTATLNQRGLSIQAANIYTDKNGYCYDSFFVLDEQGNALKDKQIKQQIKQAIIHNATHIESANLSVQRRLPRQFKYFNIPTQVDFVADEYSGYTRLELTTRDQPGLLAMVGEAFKTTHTKLHDARITTLGEKVEDTFIISHRNNSPITDEKQHEKIRREIKRRLDK